MKAAVYHEYGPADVLHIAEVAKPVPADNEVLIKVHATTVTAGDCNARGFVFMSAAFKPIARMMFGFNKPRQPILGVEIAGEVESVGKDVTSFKPGDQVFGISTEFGAYAQYASRAESGPLLTKPAGLSYEEAAAIPFGAGTALSFLRDRAQVKSGQRILINGASGSVGVYAVQIAKYYGAEVTGVCSTANVELVKSLGADHVIDYTKDDFRQSGQTYDIILDNVPGQASFDRCKNSLTPTGLYMPVAGGIDSLFQSMFTAKSKGRKVMAGPAFDTKESLQFIKELVEAGKIKPVIDRRYPLDEIAEAHRYVDQGHKKGNVVITVA